MITIERIQEIVKEQFGRNLTQGWGHSSYSTKDNIVYVALGGFNDDRWIVSLQKSTKRKGTLEITNHRITTEKELMTFIRKFKKFRKAM